MSTDRAYRHSFDLSAQKSDTVDLTIQPYAIYVGGAGDIKVDMVSQHQGSVDAVTFKAVPVGTILPIRPKRLYSTGTTATLLIGLY